MDCLLLGIEQHESGDLSRAAYFFERSAKEKGGLGAGMLLWGLSLVHGWGIGKDQEKGFMWLQKAAESVVEDLGEAVKKGGLQGNETDVRAQAAKVCFARAVIGLTQSDGWLNLF